MRLRRRFAPIETFALIALIVVSIAAGASPAVGQDAPNGATVFKSKCVTCHGSDGAGTAVGKSLKVADLRSDEVQKKPDAELIQSVSDGKGNMPGFKGNLTDEEIHAAITFVRTLAAKKK
jgi:mono/diheme cytochrome c family protein